MEKDIARSLLLLVNDKSVLDMLLRYAEYRIGVLHGQLENAKETSRIFELQGQIKELRSFANLRDIVNRNATGE